MCPGDSVRTDCWIRRKRRNLQTNQSDNARRRELLYSLELFWWSVSVCAGEFLCFNGSRAWHAWLGGIGLDCPCWNGTKETPAIRRVSPQKRGVDCSTVSHELNS